MNDCGYYNMNCIYFAVDSNERKNQSQIIIMQYIWLNIMFICIGTTHKRFFITVIITCVLSTKCFFGPAIKYQI